MAAKCLYEPLEPKIRHIARLKNNYSFPGGLNFNQVKFEILADGSVKAKITMWDGWTTGFDTKEEFEGIKILKYWA